MPSAIEELRPHLQAFDFPRLFVEGLGWDHYQADPMAVLVNDRDYTLKSVAEKAGFVVYECGSSVDDNIPQYPIRRKIEREVAKRTFEHLIIFTDPGRKAQVWQWVKRESGKPAACREYAFIEGQSGNHVLQRLQGLAFAIEEEGGLSVPLVTSRVRAALDVEKVTKRFYERFRTELTAFGNFIDGVTNQGDRDWYASLMLNRMMFVYFVQKKGFLDDDDGYLRNRLRMGQEPKRRRALPAVLSHLPPATVPRGTRTARSSESARPRRAAGQSPPSSTAACSTFTTWSGITRTSASPTRPSRGSSTSSTATAGTSTNGPTGRTTRSTQTFSATSSRNTSTRSRWAPTTPERTSPVTSPATPSSRSSSTPPGRSAQWPLGRTAAFGVCCGTTPTATSTRPSATASLGTRGRSKTRNPSTRPSSCLTRLPLASTTCPSAAAGTAQRPPTTPLPTETWREVVARRQRYAKVRAKLARGEVQDINDLITLNLDVERFASDVISQSEGPELLRAFWHAMRDVSVLDPTCGSGAFLFAALNILEPLYTACLEGMRGFLDDLERTDRPHHPDALRDFREVLEQVEKHPSERYFILKSIVLNNLYGVDIMEEAVEICKLRLFLKLVAQLESYEQIEPLPDIDFNIRAGNTLVGFTSLGAVRQAMTITPHGQHRQVFPEEQAVLNRIEEEAEIASAAFNQFRWQQTMFGGEVTPDQKADLRRRLESLTNELDRYLATQYGIDLGDSRAYHAWRSSHQPFHWFVEFYGIMSQVGFNVIIGNPPWREKSAVKKEYQVRAYDTESCGNLYALCAERSIELVSQRGWFSFIVQLPFLSSSRMRGLRNLLVERARNFYYIPFDDRPGKLFDGLQNCRSVIFLTQVQAGGTSGSIHGTKYQRWSSKVREYLFHQVAFTSVPGITSHRGIFPKLATESQASLVHRLVGDRAMRPVSLHLRRMPTGEFVFYQEAMRYWAKATYGLPFYSKNGLEGAPPHGRYLYTDESSLAHCISAIINSSLFYVYFVTYSDCFHLSNTLVRDFPLADSVIGDARLIRLSHALMKDLHEKSIRKTIDTKIGDSITYEEFFAGGSKPIIDDIDQVLAQHYGFTDEELDFIINYDVKYRMGRDND